MQINIGSFNQRKGLAKGKKTLLQKGISSIRKRCCWFIVLLLVGVLCTLIGIKLQGIGLVLRNININSDLIINSVMSLGVTPDLLSIDIKYENFQKLEYVRVKAIENGTIHGLQNDWIPARIRYKERTIPAKIRLKGGVASNHLAQDEWSFRLRLKEDETLFGMKDFALMSPKRRYMMRNWFLRKVIGKEGLIVRKYEFKGVTINGKFKGIFAIDERYDKIMLERNHRKEGPVKGQPNDYQ